jgi:4-hydroxybenzoate polyprenyltransferase
LRLARADRPIGFFLLALPCLWSVSLASRSLGEAYPDPWLLLLFLTGAIVMRGAGCTYNDIVDRGIDARVARTRTRPLPSGQVTTVAAVIFMLLLCLAGLTVLLNLNRFSILLAIGALPIVALYPFVKRISHWPQAVLGLAFNWGALMGWAAVLGRLDLAHFRPLCRRGLLDDRLRHDLRPSGSRGRWPARGQIDGAASAAPTKPG